MYAADAAGGEDIDAGQMRGDHGGRHCCRAIAPHGDADGHVRARDLHDIFGGGELFELCIAQADMQLPVENRDCRRFRAIFAHGRFDATGDVDVLRIGHAMGDNGTFQRHDGFARGLGVGNRCRELHGDHFMLPPDT